MGNQIRQSLGTKMLLFALAMCLLLSAAALTAVGSIGHHQMQTDLQQTGVRASAMLAAQVPVQDGQLQTEQSTAQLQQLARELAAQNGVSRICMVCTRQEGTTVLLDSAGQTVLTEKDSFAAAVPQLQGLQSVQRVQSREESGARCMVTLYPVTAAGETAQIAILTAVPMQAALIRQWSTILWAGVILLVMMLLVLTGYFHLIRRNVTGPITRLTDAVQAYEGGENDASDLELKRDDELQTLADTFRTMMDEIDQRSEEERELAVRQERLEAERKLAEAVHRAMEPRELTQISGRLNFDVYGIANHAGALNSVFYDYFLLKDGNLGVVLGEVSSDDVDAALFMVMARTIIKSQLRVGVSLLDAVNEANKQLFEAGRGMVVNAMIGILDETGVFSYVNAGQQRPLLMRALDRYEWYSVPVYAPLGQNENVTYRVRQIALRQSDRLVFYTVGLLDLRSKDGETFGERQMQASLNASRRKNMSLKELIPYIRDESTVFAGQSQSNAGFAILALDYLRSRKDRAHCLVTADSSGAMEISSFLKRQLGENGFSQKTIARTAVLADEVFALCCIGRQDSLITLECVVDRQQKLVTLHWKGTFGTNPLVLEEGIMEHNLEYIQSNVKESFFRHGERQDVLTVVQQLEDE